jgi:hypothetical protein
MESEAPATPATPATNTRHTVSKKIQSKQEIIIPWLQAFYNKPGHMAALLAILASATISLRLIDWFVTNYTKKYNITYLLNGAPYSVYFHYRRELKAYSKRLFDPFCRRERIRFLVHGEEPLEGTTIGQLNFFRWAIEKNVIPYILEHAEEIEKDMNTSNREHYSKDKKDEELTPTGRRKRKEMSKTVTRSVTRYSSPVMVSFD